MRYGSVCSGIEAATMAWHHMGWEPAFFSEIEKFPRAVLEYHYPDVPLHGDFTTIERNQYGKIDLLVGGTPCQSFSVAGLRGGLGDERGNLSLEFCRLAQREQPRWIVWENVPGVLSSNGGRDFGSILGALEDLGYGLAYRVLDAQYFGVAQRRRRVFVVGYLGDWRPAAAVLFERNSMSGHPAPSREKRQDAARSATPSAAAGGGHGLQRSDLAGPLTAGIHKGPRGTEAVDSNLLVATGADLGPGCEALVSTQPASGVAVNIGGSEPRLSDVVGTLDCWSTSGRGSSQQLAVLQNTPDTVGTLRTRRPGEGGVQGDFDHIVPVISPALNTQSGSHHAPDTKAYVAFAQNTRDEVRLINGDGQITGALAASSGMKQTNYIAFDTTQITSPHNHSNPRPGDPCHPLAAGAHPPAIAFSSKDYGADATEDCSPTLRAGSGIHQNGGVMPAVAYPLDTQNMTEGHTSGGKGFGEGGDPSFTLTKGHSHAVAYSIMPMNSGKDYKARETDVAQPIMAAGPVGGNQGGDYVAQPAIGWSEELTASVDLAGTLQRGGSGGRHDGVMAPTSAVRRLTTVECERLQGFPDQFTAIPWNKKLATDCPDGPRYKALGNSMAVPVMRWIGERIRIVDDLISVL